MLWQSGKSSAWQSSGGIWLKVWPEWEVCYPELIGSSPTFAQILLVVRRGPNIFKFD